MCDIFHITHLGVRYEIYPLSFSFDLRCQSGVYIYIYIISLKTMESEETENGYENNLTITFLSNTSHKSLSTELLTP